MIINGEDIRKYRAKQLKVEVQPPKISPDYEILTHALIPTEYDTDIPLGTMKMSLYFRTDSRNELNRTISAFMRHFKTSVVIEDIKGFRGKYRGYLTANSSAEKCHLLNSVLSLTLDGYFFDDPEEVTFDGKTEGTIQIESSRDAPCVITVTAKSDITNYKMTIGDDDYTIGKLKSGKQIIIDGIEGKVTQDGVNDFGNVDMWQFPKLQTGKTSVKFSSSAAQVTVKYTPMWI